MYKRIASAESTAGLAEVRAELEDRYGKPPEGVLHLLRAAEIRLIAEALGITQIERKRTAMEEAKPAAPARSPAPPAGLPAQWPRLGSQRPELGGWAVASTPLPGRHGQAPQVPSLQYSNRAAVNRPVTNASMALRQTTPTRSSGAAQAGLLRPMREMLYITFSDKLHATPQPDGVGINVGMLMKLVARQAKQGARLTPQGTLRWPLSGAQAEVVLAETLDLLERLQPQPGPQ